MGKAFDVGLERLVGASVCGSVPEGSGEWRVALPSSGQASSETYTEEQIPQRLKPRDEASLMSDLKVRPPKRENEDPRERELRSSGQDLKVQIPKNDDESGTAAGLEDSPSLKLRRTSSPCATGGGQTFYLETFGCQMNEHDSEKVAGVLLARGYKQVERADQANVVLYNTCSIREKAAQKVFSRLGEWRPGDKRSSEWRVASDESEEKTRTLENRGCGTQERKTQDPPSKDEDGAPEKAVESDEWRVAGAQALHGSERAGVPFDDAEGKPAPQERPASLRASGQAEGGPYKNNGAVKPPLQGKRQPIIGVLGCVAQQEGEEIFKRAPWVSLVCGSASYRKLPELLRELEAGNRRVTGLDTDTDETFETEITRRDNPWRAYLTIIEGCDKACSYCVVPFTRGPERSRTSASILAEVRQLAEAGYTEVQLLGQTVNSYADPSARKMRFSELLVAVAEVPGIRRVRFTTSHPRDFGKDIVEAIEAVPGICEHVHLPVQSGSTNVLRAMARTYTREEYLEKIALMKAAKREISITTDIIVGFPGETEKDFEETLSLMEAVKYDGAFCFKYSPRPNTPSLKMVDGIPEEEKSRRLGVLLEKQREIQRARNERLVGETLEVLVEGKSRRENQWSGHTSSNKVMNFTSQREESLGDYVRVKVVGALPNSLVGIWHGDTESTEEGTKGRAE